jgi:hypothetical protein
MSLRASAFKNPFPISASISVSRNSTVKQRNPSRLRFRERRMRSAGESGIVSELVDGTADISLSCVFNLSSYVAFMASSETLPKGERAAACIWNNEAFTKSLDVVPRAFLSRPPNFTLAVRGMYWC